MDSGLLYSDDLIELFEDAIVLRNYYFPFGSKRVDFPGIDQVLLVRCTFWTGKYRFYGTGDFQTWFAPDRGRASRDWIFILYPKHGWWRMGFTVKDSAAVERILREAGLNVVKHT